MITVTIEGDDSAVIGFLKGHVMAFFNADAADLVGTDLGILDAEFVRLVIDGRTGRLDVEASKVIPLLYNAPTLLYNTDLYLPDETPYRALWRALSDVLSPRLYTCLKREFDQKNTAYSTRARNKKSGKKEGQVVKQKTLF